jgi:N6-adenosine-specific RNA methylase IME4
MKFRVIYCDPPWKHNVHAKGRVVKHDAYRNVESRKHYKGIMSLQELMNLDVPRVCADDAVLFLWVLDGYIESAFRLMRAWEFIPKTVAFDWIKTYAPIEQQEKNGRPINRYLIQPRSLHAPITMHGHELCLYGTRGCPIKAGIFHMHTGVKQVQYAPVTGHSAKPPIIRELIQKTLTTATKRTRLEMFARGSIPGWTVFGNEAKGTIKFPHREFKETRT